MHEGGERVVRQLLGAVAQHSLERRVRLDDLARKVDPRDADGRPIEDGSESFLTLAQRPLDLFAFGDVEEAGHHLGACPSGPITGMASIRTQRSRPSARTTLFVTPCTGCRLRRTTGPIRSVLFNSDPSSA